MNSIPRTWHECTDTQLNKIFDEVCFEAGNAGYKVDVENLYMFKSTRKWGEFKLIEGIKYIGINNVYDENPEKARNTIIHEVAHSIKPYCKHDYEWRKVGNNIGKKWGIEMSVKTSDEDEGLVITKPREEAKYIIKCPMCGNEWEYSRLSKVVKNPEKYKCGKCNCNLVRIK